MINVADLPAVRAQIERAAATDNEKPAPPAAPEAAPAPRPKRRMVLDGDKYRVVEDGK